MGNPEGEAGLVGDDDDLSLGDASEVSKLKCQVDSWMYKHGA